MAECTVARAGAAGGAKIVSGSVTLTTAQTTVNLGFTPQYFVVSCNLKIPGLIPSTSPFWALILDAQAGDTLSPYFESKHNAIVKVVENGFIAYLDTDYFGAQTLYYTAIG